MLRRFGPITLILLLTLQLPRITGARAAEPDPGAFLPPNTTVRQTVQGDVDGDSRDDMVALYGVPGMTAAQPMRAGLLVLLTTDAGVRPVHLFGQPPADLRGEPILDANGSTDLTLWDVAGDGRKRIILTVINRFPNTADRTTVWVFGAGETALLPTDPEALRPLPPPWVGTGFRSEAYLEGDRVEFEHHAPGAPSILRRQMAERSNAPESALVTAETYHWRGDGFRLAARAMTLPDAAVGSARSPQAAVISFYAAQARGDLTAAIDLLGDELRAGRSATATEAAPDPSIRVEEVRVLSDHLTWQATPDTDQLVAVRVSMNDPRQPPAHSEADPKRHTIAGTWRAQKIGERWRLTEANHHETASLPAISERLPAGVSIIQTAGGDLRGLGAEDVAVLAANPGRFTLVEPYILFGVPGGGLDQLEPAVPVASYVQGGLLGGPFGTIGVADVNADGKLELTFGGIVGAHSAVLWVLHWNGSTLAPLFAEVSNSPVVGLEDLDGDGVDEILLVQSGYCGSYAGSPVLAFAFRWEGGAYRSASWRYPALQGGVDERAEAATSSTPTDPSAIAARACVQHMLALSHAFRGQSDETRTAYRAYADLRQQTSGDSRTFLRPIYLGGEYVAADIRAVIAAADSGQSPGWSAAGRATLFDLLGDSLLSRAQNHQSEAEDAARRNRPEKEREARRKASEARQAATQAYQSALALDPTDEEARRALGE